MKILGSDYDGTLYCGGISEENLVGIARWQAQGNKFGIVSGRGVDFPAKLKTQYPHFKVDFFVLCNGAYILDGEGNVIFSAPCREVSPRELIFDLLSWGCDFVQISAHKCWRVLADLKNTPAWGTDVENLLVEDLEDVDFFYQFSVRQSDDVMATRLVETIREKYGRWLNPLQNGRCIDIVASGVNKSTGMTHVMTYYGVTTESVRVVGDQMNDLDMIRTFPSFAMESGNDALKTEATGVVRNVAELIEREFNGKEECL